MIRTIVNFANEHSDGHFTIMKFTTNWKIAFETITSGHGITEMATGDTLKDAFYKAKDRIEREALLEGLKLRMEAKR